MNIDAAGYGAALDLYTTPGKQRLIAAVAGSSTGLSASTESPLIELDFQPEITTQGFYTVQAFEIVQLQAYIQFEGGTDRIQILKCRKTGQNIFPDNKRSSYFFKLMQIIQVFQSVSCYPKVVSYRFKQTKTTQFG